MLLDREPRRQRRRDDELRILALAGRQAIEALERRLAESGVRLAKLPAVQIVIWLLGGLPALIQRLRKARKLTQVPRQAGGRAPGLHRAARRRAGAEPAAADVAAPRDGAERAGGRSAGRTLMARRGPGQGRNQ